MAERRVGRNGRNVCVAVSRIPVEVVDDYLHDGGDEMNPDVVFEILNLAVSLAQAHTTGKVQQDATLAGILLQIIGKAIQAYHDHTGETVDLSLIKSEQVL